MSASDWVPAGTPTQLNAGERSAPSHEYLLGISLPFSNPVEQILALAKVFIDSLNEKELARGIDNKENAKGLDKFEAWLKARGGYREKMFEFLRKVQALRSACSAHRKGENYDKLKPFFKIDEMDLTAILEDILIKCVWTLRTLEKGFLPEDTSDGGAENS